MADKRRGSDNDVALRDSVVDRGVVAGGAAWRRLSRGQKLAVGDGQAVLLALTCVALAAVATLPLAIAAVPAGGPSQLLSEWWGVGLAVLLWGCAVAFCIILLARFAEAEWGVPRQVLDRIGEFWAGVWMVSVGYVVWRQLFGVALDSGHLALQLPLVVLMALLGLLLLTGSVGLPGRIRQSLGREVVGFRGTATERQGIKLAVWPAWIGFGLIAYGSVNAFLLRRGIGSAPKQPHDGSELFSDAVGTEIVGLLDAVPILDLAGALRLDPRLAYTDRWTGIVQILFKLAVVAPMLPVVVAAAHDLAIRIGPSDPAKKTPGDDSSHAAPAEEPSSDATQR